MKSRMNLVAAALVAFGLSTVSTPVFAKQTSTDTMTTKKKRSKKSTATTGTMAPATATTPAPAAAAPAAPAAASPMTSTAKAKSSKGAMPPNNASDADIASAKAAGKVWVNTESKVYHKSGRYYGKTKQGQFMTEDDAKKAGYHEAKGEVGGKS